jgi:D-alanyl-D-alanine carboxypeptidase/D-alanyl-D-alanine-endopeptidase (penicillin-binding protein 4)
MVKQFKNGMLKWILILCCGFHFPLCSSISQECARSLNEQIEQIICRKDPYVHIGIEVRSIKTGEEIYQKNAQQLFVPASNVKLLTGAAALFILGPQFRFETKLWTDGVLKDGILKGNLYLEGSGDPVLDVSDLEELVQHMHTLGIQAIEGDLYVDPSLFDAISKGPGWMWDEGTNRWAALIDALTLHRNCIDISVKPAEQIGGSPRVNLFPKTSYITVANQAETSAKDDQLCVTRRWMNKENIIDVVGHISLNQEEKHYEVAIEHPHLYAGYVFGEMLNKEQLVWKGKIGVRKTPSQGKLLCSHLSCPLQEIVEEMLKDSDNLIADCLFKKLGEHSFGAPGTWQKGAQAMREFLSKQVGIDVEKTVIIDGCGLSRYNLFSPSQFVKFLCWVQNRFPYRDEFVFGLPVSGIDGTLTQRMEKKEVKGKVQAKTGAMTGISTLSGYVHTKDGDLLAFSILQNGFIGSILEYKTQIEDEICVYLANCELN